MALFGTFLLLPWSARHVKGIEEVSNPFNGPRNQFNVLPVDPILLSLPEMVSKILSLTSFNLKWGVLTSAGLLYGFESQMKTFFVNFHEFFLKNLIFFISNFLDWLTVEGGVCFDVSFLFCCLFRSVCTSFIQREVARINVEKFL